MTAFLGVYLDWGENQLKRQDHRHGEGEDRSRCPNCKVNGAAAEMSAFELAAWNWYQETVSPFTLKAGIVAEMFKGLGLTGETRALFFKALTGIREMFEEMWAIQKKRRQDAMQNQG